MLTIERAWPPTLQCSAASLGITAEEYGMHKINGSATVGSQGVKIIIKSMWGKMLDVILPYQIYNICINPVWYGSLIRHLYSILLPAVCIPCSGKCSFVF